MKNITFEDTGAVITEYDVRRKEFAMFRDKPFTLMGIFPHSTDWMKGNVVLLVLYDGLDEIKTLYFKIETTNNAKIDSNSTHEKFQLKTIENGGFELIPWQRGVRVVYSLD